MRQVFLYDKDGFYLYPLIIADKDGMPKNCTEEMWSKLYKPKRENGQWVEGITQEEIAAAEAERAAMSPLGTLAK